jgi:hypothetical protein
MGLIGIPHQVQHGLGHAALDLGDLDSEFVGDFAIGEVSEPVPIKHSTRGFGHRLMRAPEAAHLLLGKVGHVTAPSACRA